MGTWLLGTAIVGSSMAVALLAQLLVRRFVPLAVLEAHHTVAGHMMALVGGVFGVLLAFSVVVVWEQYDRDREGAGQEANAAADLFRLVRAAPPPAGEQMAQAVFDYLRAVAEIEWDTLDRSGAAPEAIRAYEGVWRTVTAWSPADDRERNLQLSALARLAELSDRRRLRLLHAEHQLPEVLWLVLVVGAAVTVGYSNFFGLRYRRSQAAMIVSLAGIVALVLFTVWVLDHPYRGDTRIRSTDFRRVIEMVEER